MKKKKINFNPINTFIMKLYENRLSIIVFLCSNNINLSFNEDLNDVVTHS